jgi:hypothetical protein
MGVALNEQETVIQISRDEDVAHIWTSDTMVMTKLDHNVEDSSEWECTKVGVIEGVISDKEYTCPKSFISFRKKKRTMSEEQKKAAAERMKLKTEH